MAKYSEGDAIGEGLEVINPDAGRDTKRRRYVAVRCVRPGCRCGGRKWTVREDKLRSGKTVSCGRVSKDNCKRWMAFNVVHRTNLDSINPDLIAMADADRMSRCDARTGETVPGDVTWRDGTPRQAGKQPLHDRLSAEPEQLMAQKTSVPAPATPKSEPTPADEFRAYLTVTPAAAEWGAPFGFVSFERVPRQLRMIDGKLPREHLESAGLINSRLALTEKGKNWLTNS
jgi:hypothetical protein